MRKWIVGLNTLALLGLLGLTSIMAEEPQPKPDTVTVTNIAAWQHPVKAALQQNRIALLKVVIRNKIDPAFYVRFPMDLSVSSVKYYDSVCRAIAKANGYWNYEIEDEKRPLRFMVTGNVKLQKVVNILANGDAGQMERLLGEANGTGAAVFEKVARQTVGLDNVPYLDLGRFKLNPRLLVEGKARDENRDFKEGLAQSLRGLILCDRFKQPIIGDLTIGTPMTQVLKILGPPSFSFDGQIFYKTSRFYLGFAGTTKVEKAIIGPLGRKIYAKEMLLRLANVLNQADSSGDISELLSGKTFNGFFDRSGHIHGGGYYLDSEAGVNVTEFDGEQCIRVYNNFQGDLYRLKSGKGKYPIIFENTDYIAGRLSTDLQIFDQYNEDLAQNGVLSPSGKRKFVYEWITSDQQYFYVRTLDYSRVDVFIGAMTEDYRWLNDDYIIYTDCVSTKPYAAPVDGRDGGNVDVLEAIGLKLSDEDSHDFKFKLKSVTKDQLVIEKTYDTAGKAAELIKINFAMDAKGKLQFRKG
ncbi:MAG TPA: hypothetical protein VHY08_09335 [Bacillota bacterium]|nr:hypothetical protein [Bacillota bacterium]